MEFYNSTAFVFIVKKPNLFVKLKQCIMVANNISQMCCISPKAFQLVININTEFPYTSSKLSLYKREGIVLIKEVASRVQSELIVLVDNTISSSMVINKSHLELVKSKVQMLANMIDDLLGISAYKLWFLLSCYITDLQLVSGLLTDA